MAHGPLKKPSDFGDNLDNVTLGSWLGWVRVTVLGGVPPYSSWNEVTAR